MNTFTLILLIVCILFSFYKIIMRFLRIFIAKKSCDNHVEFTVNQVNNCNLSSPSYDFPNIQSEVDIKIINSGPDLCDEQDSIEVKQYCKY